MEKAKKVATPAKKVSSSVKKEVVSAKKVTSASKKETAVMKERFYIQFLGKDFEKVDLMDRVKAAYKEAGNKAAIKSIDVYVKFEESAVYYVINEKVSGRFEI